MTTLLRPHHLAIKSRMYLTLSYLTLPYFYLLPTKCLMTSLIFLNSAFLRFLILGCVGPVPIPIYLFADN